MNRMQQQLTLLVVSIMLMLANGRGHADPWYDKQGEATWYGKQFHGRTAANGQRFSEHEMTAAHRTLPLGTKVMVENLATGEQIEVKITDRGPYVQPARRIIDLSRAAADSIGIVQQGKQRVRVVMTEEAPPAATKEELFYEVQVGAFEESDPANMVLESLQERFPEAYIVPREGPSGEYYRVRIGPFATEEEAKQVAKVLQREGHHIFLDELSARAVPPQAPAAATEKAIEGKSK